MLGSNKQNSITDIQIRHHFDADQEVLYLCVVDVIESLNLSTNSRNYWRVLKSRFKKADNELVTKCNQVKMQARDGKSYKTDALDTDSMLKLIQEIAPNEINKYRKIFKHIEDENNDLDATLGFHEDEFSTENDEELEFAVDAYIAGENIFINTMLPGVEPSDIFVLLSRENILIKGERKEPNIPTDDYYAQELHWGKFTRSIDLPEEVDIDNAQANFRYGFLQIKLTLIDKERTQILKIK